MTNVNTAGHILNIVWFNSDRWNLFELRRELK